MIVFRRGKPFNQADFIEIPISYFECIKNSYTYKEDALIWPRLVKEWAFEAAVIRREKRDASLISPTHFCLGRRSHANAINAGMVVLDSDGLLPLDTVAAIFGQIGVAAIIYTSARNRPEDPRFRLMVPLGHLVSAQRYRKVTRAIVRIIKSELTDLDSWKIDTSKFHCGDLFYLPGTYQIATSDDGEEFTPTNEFRSLDGEIWDASMWIDLADAAAPEPVVIPVKKTCPLKPATFDHHSKWSPETHVGEKIDRYLGLSDGRQAGLFGLMSSIACSAYYFRYDLSDSELADIAHNIQRQNSPRKPYTYGKLLQNAGRVIAEAASYVGEQERYPESRDTLAEQLAALGEMRIEENNSSWDNWISLNDGGQR